MEMTGEFVGVCVFGAIGCFVFCVALENFYDPGFQLIHHLIVDAFIRRVRGWRLAPAPSCLPPS